MFFIIDPAKQMSESDLTSPDHHSVKNVVYLSALQQRTGTKQSLDRKNATYSEGNTKLSVPGKKLI